jgi:ribose 5-phosphate isomerase A
MSNETLKKAAAEKAVEQVKSGMVLGLGTGSTTRYAIIKIGQLWQAGSLTGIVAVPTSEASAALARQYDMPLASLADQPQIDLAIDGADEVDPTLNLIKGLGGALLREKMVELAAAYFIVVVDHSKVVPILGSKSPLPVEVTQFGWQYQADWLAATFNCRPALRGAAGQPFITDNGNYILDCTFPTGISDPQTIATQLKARTGVVEHGLFLGLADEVIIAEPAGLRLLKTPPGR